MREMAVSMSKKDPLELDTLLNSIDIECMAPEWSDWKERANSKMKKKQISQTKYTIGAWTNRLWHENGRKKPKKMLEKQVYGFMT